MAYYASALHPRHPGRTVLLAGPYNQHGPALAAAARCPAIIDHQALGNERRLVEAFDIQIGTLHAPLGRRKLGRLNADLGYTGPGQLP